jgi:hypothetical protein
MMWPRPAPRTPAFEERGGAGLPLTNDRRLATLAYDHDAPNGTDRKLHANVLSATPVITNDPAMSLRSEVEQSASPIRRFLEGRFPLAGGVCDGLSVRLAKRPTLRPDTSAGNPPWSQIGMTVGYRLGYALGNQSHGLAILGAGDLSEHHRLLARELVSVIGDLGAPGPIGRLPDADEERIARVCWALALYETIFRAGAGINTPLRELSIEATVEDLLALASPAWIEDVIAQMGAAVDGLVAHFSHVPAEGRRPGVTFAGSADVGGADADLLIGSTLIEVKTTIQTRPEKMWVYQLIGYALLDYDNRWNIDEVGFYFPRQALLVRWELESLLRRMLEPDRANGLRRPRVDVAETRARLAEILSIQRSRPTAT